VTYSLRIRNTGDVTATEARLVDPLAAELTLLPGSLSGAGASYDAQAREIRWEGVLAPGGPASEITYQARIADDLPVNTTIVNSATLYERGTLMGSLQATLGVNEVNLEESDMVTDALKYRAGEEVLYTLSLVNSGLATAPQVMLTDTLPIELELLPETLVGAASDEGRRTLSWEGSLAPDEPYEITFSALILPQVLNGTIITNEAMLADGFGGFTTLAAPIRVLRGDLSGSDMRVRPTWKPPGGRIEFTVRLRNGGEAVLGAVMTDTLPLALIPLADTAYASAGQVAIEGRTLVWSGETLPHSMVIVRYAAMVEKETVPQRILNEALVVDEGGLATTVSVVFPVSPAVIYLPISMR
jgi:uncharacterized repeat protein (TIGR01451 family)